MSNPKAVRQSVTKRDALGLQGFFEWWSSPAVPHKDDMIGSSRSVPLAEPQTSTVPVDEVIVTLGQPALLSCHLGKLLDPKTTRIYWQTRNVEPKVLHAHNKGSEELDMQDDRYRNRTSIYGDLIHQGNLSLLISEAKAEDDNTELDVIVQENGLAHPYCSKRLRVTARFQKPEVNVSCLGGVGQLKIVCTSHGGFPEPKVNWTGLHRQDNNPPPMVTVNPNDSTYTIRSTLYVNLTKDQSATCYVTNPTSQETVNTSITPRVSCPDMYPPDHTTIVIICTAVLVIAIIGCPLVILLYKREWLTCSGPNQSGREVQDPALHPDETTGLHEMENHACCDT
ncbi:hypothetical protein SKAU_G00240320 [Synaphobranchus kaupii]|uniref:Ig-like domain-containing protein n=1 Tax=Synaphobranchus kaupii TaxID=118154 RepID=A0A9Q1IUA6_SYNKA|nr:hypothetical protein SKAU_G00240320 [Synaphobranchus kaupii]